MQFQIQSGTLMVCRQTKKYGFNPPRRPAVWNGKLPGGRFGL